MLVVSFNPFQPIPQILSYIVSSFKLGLTVENMVMLRCVSKLDTPKKDQPIKIFPSSFHLKPSLIRLVFSGTFTGPPNQFDGVKASIKTMGFPVICHENHSIWVCLKIG